MKTSTEESIVADLKRYIAGGITIQQFDESFAEATWEVERSNEERAKKLTDEIELALAEYSNGDWTEDELRDLFRQAISAPAGAGRG